MSQHQLKHIHMVDRLNAVLTYIEFFKSSMTDIELLTAILDQMDKHSVHLNIIKGYHNTFLKCVNEDLIPGEITAVSESVYQILTDLESKCKNDITNKQQ